MRQAREPREVRTFSDQELMALRTEYFAKRELTCPECGAKPKALAIGGGGHVGQDLVVTCLECRTSGTSAGHEAAQPWSALEQTKIAGDVIGHGTARCPED